MELLIAPFYVLLSCVCLIIRPNNFSYIISVSGISAQDDVYCYACTYSAEGGPGDDGIACINNPESLDYSYCPPGWECYTRSVYLIGK